MKALVLFGTRPEAIKLAPILRELAASPSVRPVVCVSGQHRTLLDQVLSAFSISPRHDLDVMTEDQSPLDVMRAILERIEPVLVAEEPDLVLVQGDAETAVAGALAAYYARIPVAHVEAGLRTGDRYAPFPEEMNRRLVDAIACLHFAPTEEARGRLLGEGVAAEGIFVTGNTEIDALVYVRDQIAPPVPFSFPGRLVLVTAHRRESLEGGIARICLGLRRLAERTDVTIVYPVHPNPHVRSVVEAELLGVPRIVLLGPLDYVSFVHLMAQSTLILTDSGGVQEAGAALHIPLLVLRDKTERVEGLASGAARLVGTDPERIASEVGHLLDDRVAYEEMKRARNPYGDGKAAERIRAILEGWTP